MRRRSDEQPVSDINITPLTDVMMVLLIIFMISSPILLARGIEVHLPQVVQAPALAEEDHVLYVTQEGALILDGVTYTSIDDITTAFGELVQTADVEGEVVNLFLRADKSVTYEVLTGVMGYATQAGIERISLVEEVLEPPQPPPEEVAPESLEEPAPEGDATTGEPPNQT